MSNNFIKLLNEFPDKPWNWEFVSSNSNITWDIINNNPDKPWNGYCISMNPNITWDIIRDNPDKPWDLYYLTYNPNITWDIIKDNPDKDWDWNVISSKLFYYDPYFKSDTYIKKMTKLMHDKIHEELISKSCHPTRIYNWNEDYCDQFGDEYNSECDKWR